MDRQPNAELRILKRLKGGVLEVAEIWEGGYQILKFPSAAALMEYAGDSIPTE